MKRLTYFLLLVLSGVLLIHSAETGTGSFYLNGAIYQDWMGFTSGDTGFYSRLSTRLKLDTLDRPGDGWTLSFDIRDRVTLGEGGKNQLIVYNSSLNFMRPGSRIWFSLGQMNLYNTAGIGELTGGLVGFRLNRSVSVGGYGGINPDLYGNSWDPKYMKYGIFSTYRGRKARSVSVSYNVLTYNGFTEREYLYSNVLLPVSDIFILYASLEYDLKEGIRTEDRLTHLFTNARLELGRKASLNFNYSRGRGIDYHQFILNQTIDPSLRIADIERYYYSESYSARLTVTPMKKLRLHLSKNFNEQKDEGIRNDSTRIGISAADILGSGVGIYGNFTLNRGDLSESDAYLFSLSRNIGRFSLSLGFSSYFNGIRMDGLREPVLTHIPDRRTVTADLFFYLNRSFAVSTEYSYSFSDTIRDHQFFLRIIYRIRKS